MKVASIPPTGPKFVAHTDFCVQMKILQLLEFGYIFCLFSQKYDRKGSSQKNSHRRRISPSSTVVYSIKTVVCMPIIYRTYVESTLSIMHHL